MGKNNHAATPPDKPGRQFNPERQRHFPAMPIAVRRCLRHPNVMGPKPIERTAPNLFTTATASALPATSEATESEPRRDAPSLEPLTREIAQRLRQGRNVLIHCGLMISGGRAQSRWRSLPTFLTEGSQSTTINQTLDQIDAANASRR